MLIMRQNLTYVWVMILSLFLIWPVHAKEVGEVVNLLGILQRTAGDKVEQLKKGAKVNVGDILLAKDGSYAQIKFIDKGEMILRPDTEVIISDYGFDLKNPTENKAKLEITKGGLRRLTGLIGKTKRDEDQLKTPTATVGIRGTVYDSLVCTPTAGDCGDLASGEYFSVKSGSIEVKSPQGNINIPAGKVGNIKQDKNDPNVKGAPIILDKDPGLPPFNPPKEAQIGGEEEGGGQCDAALDVEKFLPFYRDHACLADEAGSQGS